MVSPGNESRLLRENNTHRDKQRNVTLVCLEKVVMKGELFLVSQVLTVRLVHLSNCVYSQKSCPT